MVPRKRPGNVRLPTQYVHEQAGATLSYTFNGTGLEILAGTKKTAVLRVTIDDEIVSEDEETHTADDMNTIYSLSGLTYGQHSITLEVLEGTLSVDMVGILGNRYQTPPPPTAEPPAPETPTPPAGNPHASAAPAPQTSSPAIQTPSLNAGLKKGTIVTAGKAKYEITDPAKKEAAFSDDLCHYAFHYHLFN